MVIFRLRNQRNGRAFVGAASAPDTIMNCTFPPALLKDFEDCQFSTQIICEYNNKGTIERKIAALLDKEIDPYNDEPEEAPVEYPPVEEEIIFEAPLDDIEEYDIG